ncbi:DUF3157 family protein [Shewanella sp. Isolate11]|uniref:DUF3157 family protein n=1 Tax=Shewanella sp. Isolate11 TaxID=2908530 RepID=UPI001EFCDCE4|nr:DUF3157 family protein [Shewanella sp. Isolate11]MCG9698399.1 DUF3157 family protein [Shewanella sp. Isolate11]
MYKALQAYSFLAFALVALPSVGDEVSKQTMAVVTLENGAKVQLNDDFTWEYLFIDTPAAQAAPQVTDAEQMAQQTAEAINPSINTAPVVAGALTNSAINQAQLLKSTAKDGVKVSYLTHQWDDKGRLGLNFELSSQSSDSYVLIELEVSLFDDDGQPLVKQTLPVWQAIFRMPETYLRKGQTRNSDTLWFEGVDKARWQKQLLTLKVKDMDSR